MAAGPDDKPQESGSCSLLCFKSGPFCFWVNWVSF